MTLLTRMDLQRRKQIQNRKFVDITWRSVDLCCGSVARFISSAFDAFFVASEQ